MALCCIPVLVCAQTIAPPQLREDLRILQSALEEGHPGIYRYTPKSDVDHAFAAGADKLNLPMTALEFYRVLLQGKIFVFRDYSPDGNLAGAEIQSLNGIPASKLLAALLAVEHGDGDTPTAGPFRLGHGAFARDLYLLAGIEDLFRVHYRLGGKAGVATVQGLPRPKLEEIVAARFPQDKRPAVSEGEKLYREP